MSEYASVNGIQVTHGSLTMGYYGRWVADLNMATPNPIAKACTVVLGGITLIGSAVRTAPYAGARSARLVAGANGWPNVLKPMSYLFQGGVMLSMVLRDAALALGEQVDVAQDVSLGAAWTRPAQSGAELLRQVTNGLWWIDATGVTRVASARPAPTITSDFTVISSDPEAGEYEIASEFLQDWIPGATFTAPTLSGTIAISSTTFTAENNGTLRLRVLGQGAEVQ